MGQLFDWVYKITVVQRPSGFVGSHPQFFERIGDAIEITEMRMKFTVKKSLGKEPNSCKIVITNLSEHTRNELEKKPLGVTLAAGYRDSGARLLFTGDLARSVSTYKGTDWETTLQVHDGGRAYAHARSLLSYKRGVRVEKVISDVAATMGLKLPPEAEQSPELKQALATGISLHGPSRDVLTQVLAPYGYNWSVQNERLQILKDGQLRAGEALLVNQDTGLIGSPQRSVPDKPGGKSELTVESLLYPEVLPGIQIKLESRTFNGEFRPKEVEHEGDTHGDDWKTKMRCT